MPSTTPKRKRWWLWLVIPLAIFLFLFFLNLGLQTFWAHREPFFYPDYARVELAPILKQSTLSDDDYQTLFLQTGLSRTAIDQLLSYGQGGIDQIEATQEGFFAHYDTECVKMLPGRFTCEDMVLDENRNRMVAVPLAPVEPGDILVSFSTHTFGWRHGHASLVVDAQNGIILEAAVMGTDSAQANMQRWQTYSDFLVLRVKGVTAEERQAVAQYALDNLDGIPYHLTSGIFGKKAPEADSNGFGAQCAYLPWYAWQAAGYDLDNSGGKIVTVADLAESPLVEIVQVYGIDPRTISP